MDCFSERFQAAKKRKEIADGIRAKINQVDRQIDELGVKISEFKKSMDKEKGDVDRLNRFSLSRPWASIRGNGVEKLKKEEQEYIEAKIRWEIATRQLEQLNKEREKLSLDLTALGNVDTEYEQVLKEKEEILKREDSPQKKRFLELIEKGETLKNKEKEIKEAINAGNRAADALRGLIDDLNTAENWGIYDMLGGGLIATAVKHSSIDKAEEQAYYAQNALSSLKKELADVNRYMDLGVHLGGLATFADYFFDGFFVDWAIQTRIEDAHSRAADQLGQVENLIAKLEFELNETVKGLERIEKEKKEILEG